MPVSCHQGRTFPVRPVRPISLTAGIRQAVAHRATPGRPQRRTPGASTAGAGGAKRRRLHQHEAQGADKAITNAIDTHVQAEQAKRADGPADVMASAG
jgi:hypothetical protein